MPCCSSRPETSTSSGGASATIRPPAISTIRSTGRCSTSSRRCSTITTVRPCSRCRSSINSTAARPAAGSRFAKGSSNSSTSTSSTSTPAIATRCFCPPESSCGEDARRSWIPTMEAACCTRCGICAWGTCWFSRLKAMSSPTVRPTNCPEVSCSTVPTRREVSTSGTEAGSLPHTRTVPVAVPRWWWGISPFSTESRVDLPEPDAPITATFSPRLITRSMSWRVGWDCARYWKQYPRSSMSGSAGWVTTGP